MTISGTTPEPQRRPTVGTALRRVAGHLRRPVEPETAEPAEPRAAGPAQPTPARTAPRADVSLARYRGLLPRGPGRRIAVLLPAGWGSELEPLLTEFAADEVLVLAADAADRPPPTGLAPSHWRTATTLAQAHDELKTCGPLHLVVDLLGGDPDPGDVVGTLFWHLRPRGMYAVQNPTGRTDVADRAATFLGAFWQGDPTHQTGPGERVLDPAEQVNEPATVTRARLEAELVNATARVMVDRGWLLVQQRLPYYLKLADDEVAAVLPSRKVEAAVTTLATRPGGTLRCRGRVVSHGAGVPVSDLDLEMTAPTLYLQHYRGRLAMIANQLLTAEATVLPASYRYPRQHHNPRVVAVGADFGRIAAKLAPTTELAGTFYHLDEWNSGHFGHTLTEVVPRLWGWHRAKELHPDLKAIFKLRYEGEREPTLELTLFEAFGIDRSDVVWVHEPTLLESVVTATTMWQNQGPYFVHPDITEVWRRLRASLVSARPDPPRRIFVSRRPDQVNRSCRNVDAVEEIFAAAGFTIVFPEDLPFTEQATLFGHAEVVAGFAGSALFNVLFAARLRTLIVVGHEAYTARYEHLFTMVLGCTTHYFWNTPDITHPVDGWSREAYYSSWAFDVERNGPALREVLAALD